MAKRHPAYPRSMRWVHWFLPYRRPRTHSYLPVYKEYPLIVVVETHPEDVVDLRLDCPWPELSELASSLNLEEMDDMEHGHVPYILILLKFLEQWNAMVVHPPNPWNF